MIRLDFEQRKEAERVLEHEIANDPDAIAFEVVALRAVARSAIAVVTNPTWCGVSDEDVLLEQRLEDAGLLAPMPPN